MSKSSMIYDYQLNNDYNKTVEVNGKKIRCYSKDKLPKMFPRGGYSFVGEIYLNGEKDSKGIIKTPEGNIPLSVVRSKKEKNWVDVGYIQVGENEFVAIMKQSRANFIYLLVGILAVLLAVGITAILVVNSMKAKPVDPDELDPHIKPIETDLVTISGIVYYQDIAVENATIILYSGDEQVSSTTTDANGKYLLSKVADGVYNISATYNNASYLSALYINKLSVVQDFYLTNTDLTVKVDIADENTPYIAVNRLYKETLNYVEDSKHVEITLFAKQLQETDVPTTDLALLKGVTGETVPNYLELSLYREVFTNSGVSESKTQIYETSNPIEIIVPYDSSRDIATYVFRVHDGSAVRFTELSERPTEAFTDGTYYVSADYVFIYSQYFSSYAIASASAGKITKGNDTITYSDKVYVNLKTNTIEMLYRHDLDSSNNSRVELYLVGETSNLLISSSGIIPPGNELPEMVLANDIQGMPSVGTYAGIMKINYLDLQGNTATSVEIPVSVAITK